MTASITSPAAIKSTIETDNHVFRWFLFLIGQKDVKKEFIERTKDGKIYTRLKLLLIIQWLCSLFLMVSLIYMLMTRQIIIAGALVLALLIHFMVEQDARRKVSAMSLKIIAWHFDGNVLGRNSLYQIGEKLANQYHVRSLVLSMVSVDEIIRKTLLYAIIFVSFIFPMEEMISWGIIITAYWLANVIINIAGVYKNLS